VPHIGYDKAAAIAKKAHETGKTIIEIVKEEKILPEKELERIFFD
jgi:aspartate ammonia-lyase